MGLLKSVIADARPAKTAGRSAFAAAPLSGQPLHTFQTDSGKAGPGSDPSTQAMGFSGESEKPPATGLNSTLTRDLAAASDKRLDTDNSHVADSGKNKPSESGSAVLQNGRANGLLQRPENDIFHYYKRIDRPFADPVHETAPAAQAVFTLIDQNVENTNLPQSHSDADRQADLEQESTHSPNEISMPLGTGGGDISDDTAIMSVGRDGNHDTAADKISGAFDSVEKPDAFRDVKTAFDAEEKPQFTTSENHHSSTNDTGHTLKQAVTEMQLATQHHTPVKLEDPQSEPRISPQPDGQRRQNNRPGTSVAPNISGDKSVQQLPMDHALSSQKPTTALSPVFVKSGEEAKLHKQSSAIQQQEQPASIEKRAGLIEARSTSVIDDRMARHHVSEPRVQRTPGVEVPRTAEVKIGRVDVFVEKSSPAASRGNRTTRPSVSLASRYYLRRL